MNHILRAIATIHDELPGLRQGQATLYALLALTKGTQTTAADVHDAWGFWRVQTYPDHPTLVPFGDLGVDVQDHDRQVLAGIHRAARRLQALQPQDATASAVVSGAACLERGNWVRGAERERIGQELAERYAAGASIRDLAESVGRSYDFARQLLLEAGVELRRRGGNHHRRVAQRTHIAIHADNGREGGEAHGQGQR